ncbi:hypothetical protein PCURB6_14370 [Paenibacillus curdlanolyticus]|nr:hypothetical protein PCURB6_14370 [Paenibacillus curdlanolyticus]
MNMIKCADCSVEKPPESYPKRSGRGTRRSICRSCLRTRKRLKADAAAREEESEERLGAQALYKDEREEAVWPAAIEQAASQESGEEKQRLRDVTKEADADPRHKKRKRTRRRKHGGKAKKAPQSGELMVEGDRTDAGRTIGDEAEPAAEFVKAADGTIEPESGDIDSASPHGEAETSKDGDEAKPAKRKRKRKRRRKGKRAVEKDTEALEPKRAAVRPPDKKIMPFKGPFVFDSSLLNDKGTGMIRLRGRRETGKRWHTEIEKDIAVRMVNEGAAGIIHPRLIHKLYTKSDFRLLILQRDNYVCRYCGRYGDTIDHVLPKSKGGLSSPMNCVCACSECNLLKADKLHFPFSNEIDG